MPELQAEQNEVPSRHRNGWMQVMWSKGNRMFENLPGHFAANDEESGTDDGAAGVTPEYRVGRTKGAKK